MFNKAKVGELEPVLDYSLKRGMQHCGGQYTKRLSGLDKLQH